MRPWLLVLGSLLVVALLAHGDNPASAQLAAGSATPSPWDSLELMDDIAPAIGRQPAAPPDVAASDYAVTPLLFVPSDVTPNPAARQSIDRQMQLIQRWYAEQLDGITFTLEPAQIVTGTHPLAYYYGGCFPPGADLNCSWQLEMWFSVLPDVFDLGFPWQSNRVRGVFIQHEGLGAPGYGSTNEFLFGIYPENTYGDCVEPGCQLRILEGAAAHELGHAFGLPHTADDPQGSPGKSLMSYGFYGFPRATLVETALNPERSLLLASPFFNQVLSLEDGGFEGCPGGWAASAGQIACTGSAQRSGLSALVLLPNGGTPYEVSQEIEAAGGEQIDLSGWIRIEALAEVAQMDLHFAHQVVITGRHALVANDSSGLAVINIQDPADPSEAGSEDTPQLAVDVAVQGHYAYVADIWGGLYVIDIGNPTAPALVGGYETPAQAQGVTLDDHFAYVADGLGGLGVFDITNPISPTLVGEFFDTPGQALDVVVVGGIAYVPDHIDGGLRLIDVSDPEHLSELGSVDTPGTATAVAVNGSYAYVGDGSGGLRIILISDPAAPVEVGSFETDDVVNDVVVSGNRAYLAVEADGLRIIDVSNPAAPYEVGAYDTAGQSQGLAMAGDHVFVADGFEGLLIFYTGSTQANVELEVEALMDAGLQLASFPVASYGGETAGWGRFGWSGTMPAGTTQARLLIGTSGVDPVTFVDDIDFGPALAVPPAPLPAVHSDGDVRPTRRPRLEWTEVSGATSFELQVALDPAFAQTVVEATTASPFYAVPDELDENRRHFWRVRAANGAGQSGWSPVWSIVVRPEGDYHDDEFDTGALRAGWEWVREDPSHWGFWGWRGMLAMTTQAGDLAGPANSAQNLLLRPAPTGDFEASTFASIPFSAESQQGGLLLYHDDDNYLKLMRVMTDAPVVELQAEVGGQAVQQAATLANTGVPLKIVREGDTYAAYYSTDGLTWRSLGEPVSVDWTAPRIGLTAYRQADAAETTAYFTWFRVRPGCAAVTIEVVPPGSGSAAQSAGDCDDGLGHSAGFTVTLSAQPAPGFVFEGWGGDVNVTDNPTDVVIQRDMRVAAHFSPEPYQPKLFLPFVPRQD